MHCGGGSLKARPAGVRAHGIGIVGLWHTARASCGCRAAFAPRSTFLAETAVARSACERAGRRVVIFSPAGMEHFFLEAGQPTADSEPDLAAVLASATRHGWQFLFRG